MREWLLDPVVQGVLLGAILIVFGLGVWDTWDFVREPGGSMGGAFRPRRGGARASAERPRRESQSFRSGAGSTQSTPTLDVWMNALTGAMSGSVKRGRFAGSRLEDLSREDLLELHAACATTDPAAEAFLRVYIERRFPGAGPRTERKRRARPRESGQLDRDESLAVLGLSAGASEADIVQAHRRLIKTHHPDHGGSHAKAARINQAKDVLLEKTR